jgi:hypothetical protein
VLPSTRIESRCEEGLVDKKVPAGEGEVKGLDLLTLPEKKGEKGASFARRRAFGHGVSTCRRDMERLRASKSSNE